MYGLSEKELAVILEVLHDNGIQEAVLFGSRAKGDYKRGSDIDIAIKGDAKKISYLLNEESYLPYFFDIVDIDAINNENLLQHIQRVGKKLI